jgi:predicted GNAT family N-acyltransferase
MNIDIQQIDMNHILYQQERELRNSVLLRPIGIPDFGWEHNDSHSRHIVALAQGELIGCALLRPHQQGPINVAQLSQMAVRPTSHGLGVGRLLISKLVELAAELNLNFIYCHARSNVVDFYLKNGFLSYDAPFTEVGILHQRMKLAIPKPKAQ